jgi:hypothetical protein
VLRADRYRHEAGALVERHWSLIERVAAALLAHGTVRGKVEAAHRRADFFEKRRPDDCLGPVCRQKLRPREAGVLPSANRCFP